MLLKGPKAKKVVASLWSQQAFPLEYKTVAYHFNCRSATLNENRSPCSSLLPKHISWSSHTVTLYQFTLYQEKFNSQGFSSSNLQFLSKKQYQLAMVLDSVPTMKSSLAAVKHCHQVKPLQALLFSQETRKQESQQQLSS